MSELEREPEREANLPAEFFEIGEEDEQLTSPELAKLSLFTGLRKIPTFRRLPGSIVLRKCQRGRVMCRQNEAGASAFYILTTQDVISLRQQQVDYLDLLLSKTPPKESSIPQKFRGKSSNELTRIRSEFVSEIKALTAQQAALDQEQDEAVKEQMLTVARVKLRVASENQRPKRRGLLKRIASWLKRPNRAEERLPLIHVDSNVPLDGKTLEANLYEGDVFGEMSCLNLAPRSATVSVVQDCYMVEFLRNVLNKLYENDEYKAKSEDIYRKRVLDKQVRQLSVFKNLPDDEFNALRDKLKLVDFESGSIIFDEHEESDCLYLVRGGLVKVVKHSSALISREEMNQTSWNLLAGNLLAKDGQTRDGLTTVREMIWGQLSADVQKSFQQTDANTKSDAGMQKVIGCGLNDFIRSNALINAFGDNKSKILSFFDCPQMSNAIANFPEKVKNWSEVRSRTFHRTLLEIISPGGMPRREVRGERTLNYLSKGDVLGEIGFLTGAPRSATCMAFDQHDRGQKQSDLDLDAKPSRVELVKLNKSDLETVSPRLLRNLEDAKQRRVATLRENVSMQSTRAQSLQSQTPEFENLGLVQGQKLMLIDLEKCTRCNACVEACVDAHDDGRNRLYLDGARFDKFLVPVTCRSCLDPVCLIGCPVSAIFRGDNGEINIRNHCIGCEICVTQCPYGSIHMSVREEAVGISSQNQFELEPGVALKDFTQKAVVCDMCNSSPSRSPACVYACPHDAAMRVDARGFFGVTDA